MIEKNRLCLHGYGIMKDHLHMIASGFNLSKEIGHFKSYTARVIIDFLEENYYHELLKQLAFFKKPHKTDQTYQVWQEGSHPQMIVDEKMLSQKMDYMHYNPVQKGYVKDPEQWQYSSYKDYMGQPGLLPIAMIEV
jgi:putative transposase